MVQESAAQVEVDVETCPTINFSEKNLRSVVYNLLSNALKYRHPDRRPQIRISCRDAGSHVVLEVQDNGLGLNTENNPKLFTMFQRFHDHVEGTGIGLYMVKKIMENAGGYISVESKVGVGATFSAYFKQ
jgi:signal transduction histidine kinase